MADRLKQPAPLELKGDGNADWIKRLDGGDAQKRDLAVSKAVGEELDKES